MKFLLTLICVFCSNHCLSAIDKTGKIKSVQIWGNIAKTNVCNGDACTTFWISLEASNANAVLSMWLAARLSQNNIYIQGYDPDKFERPFSGASRFYGMNLN